ncbi:hypothetical protein ACSFA0_25205 [Variovorax sp. LT1P1]|uniref:hypothetical protein n=1 Tax=Variovorax sp. LT1P1 TaxID=3443730 RepID=UPI003F48A8BC
MSDRYAFLLGEQLGRCRMTWQHDSANGEVERGYNYGRTLPAIRSDMFMRKVLSVRRNAFARKIPVSSALTRSYMEEISVRFCPVSGVELTHATLAETDWSVDRLDNTLGYLPGNICVMASRVNKLKGTTNVEDLRTEVGALMERSGPGALGARLECGLLCIEARRLISLMAAPTGFAIGMLGMSAPFAMAPGAWATLDGAIGAMHVASSHSIAAQAKRAALFKAMGKAEWRLSNRLAARIRAELAADTHPCDVWLDPVNERLLVEAMDLLLDKPPALPGFDAAGKAAGIKEAMHPVSRFTRVS